MLAATGFYRSSSARKMHYRLSCFLLYNLAHSQTLSWHDADLAHAEIARHHKIDGRIDSWLQGRIDYESERSFGRRLSGLIECEDCGGMYGHKTWHSGTPNRADVWECPTSHKKRGSCQPGHLYEIVLKEKLLEAMVEILRRTPTVAELVFNVFTSVLPQVEISRIKQSIDDLLFSEVPRHVFLPDLLEIVEGACMLNDRRLGFVFISSEAVTLSLPTGWTPKRQSS